MSAETDFRAALIADGAVSALVGTRIATDRIEQGAARPFVVFSRAATLPITDVAGTLLISQVTLDVQCWADTRLQADAVADAVSDAVRSITTQQVTERSSVYDADLDMEGVQLTVEWWD